MENRTYQINLLGILTQDEITARIYNAEMPQTENQDDLRDALLSKSELMILAEERALRRQLKGVDQEIGLFQVTTVWGTKEVSAYTDDPVSKIYGRYLRRFPAFTHEEQTPPIAV